MLKVELKNGTETMVLVFARGLKNPPTEIVRGDVAIDVLAEEDLNRHFDLYGNYPYSFFGKEDVLPYVLRFLGATE